MKNDLRIIFTFLKIIGLFYSDCILHHHFIFQLTKRKIWHSTTNKIVYYLLAHFERNNYLCELKTHFPGYGKENY